MTSQQQALEGFFDAVEEATMGEKSEAFTEASSIPTFGIEDGRDNSDLTLDKTSFEFIPHCPTMMTTADFFRAEQDEALRHQYFEEVISFVEKKLGCEKALCLDMKIHENGGPMVDSERLGGMEDLYGFTKPQTSTSAKVTDEMAVNLAGEDHRYKRYTVLSLWRFIEEEQDEHIGQYKQLALMDERSCVKPDDYVAREKVAYRLDGKSTVDRYYSLNPRHASSHKWYYFPNMEMDSEAILIKQMDSDWSNPGRMCFRMGVPDPRHDIASPEYISRKAAEVRMICFWEKPASGINSMPTAKDLAQQSKSSSGNNSTESSRGGKGSDGSWLDKIMYGDGKVNEWLGKIESMSQGFMEGTEKISLANLVSRAASCQGGSSAPLPLNLNFHNKNNHHHHGGEGYFGRYTKEYMDDYEDEYRRLYLPKFLEVVDSYPSWPPSSKNWARSQMLKFGHREVDRGIAEITCVIVDDSMGMVGTKNFPVSKKKKIIDFLIRNETYMYAAMAQWAPLAYEQQQQQQQQAAATPVKPMGQPPLEAGQADSQHMMMMREHHQYPPSSGAGDHHYSDSGIHHQQPPEPPIAEGRDDQPPGRSRSPKRYHHHQKKKTTSRRKASKYGKILEEQEEAEEEELSDPSSSDPTSSSYEYSSNHHHDHSSSRRSRRLHEEYSRRRLRGSTTSGHGHGHRRHSSLSSINDGHSAPTESYEEDESELLAYSERRDEVAARRQGSPEYYSDSSPGGTTTTTSRYPDEKSLAYSLESSRMLLYSSRNLYEGEEEHQQDLGEASSFGSYTHFQQRESSYHRSSSSNNRKQQHQQQRYEDEEDDMERHVYTYNVNAPYTTKTSNSAAHHHHPLGYLANRQQRSWEEPSEPSL